MVDNVKKYTKLLAALTESSVAIQSIMETRTQLSHTFDGLEVPADIEELRRANDDLLGHAITHRKQIESYINGTD